MKKQMIAMILATLASSTFANDSFFAPSSFGKWENDETSYSISQNGISALNIKGCKPVYRTEKMLGSQWLSSIQEDFQETMMCEDPAHLNTLIQITNLIDQNKHYTLVTGHLEGCTADGAFGFMQLNDKTGLNIISAPDNSYSIIYKK